MRRGHSVSHVKTYPWLVLRPLYITYDCELLLLWHMGILYHMWKSICDLYCDHYIMNCDLCCDHYTITCDYLIRICDLEQFWLVDIVWHLWKYVCNLYRDHYTPICNYFIRICDLYCNLVSIDSMWPTICNKSCGLWYIINHIEIT